jgi:hypothetical protein
LTTLTGSGTVTIPNPVLYTGQTQTFYNSTASAITLSTPSGNFIAPGIASASSISIPAGSIFTVISDGANYLAQDWLGGTVSTINLVATGGTVDGINIGVTTTGTGRFSTLNATSTTTLAGMTATTGAFSGISTFTNSAAATLGTTGTGAVQVTGGASIGGILNVGGKTYHGDSVGIGTNNPGSILLDIAGTNNIRHTYTGANGGILFGQYNTTGDAQIQNQSTGGATVLATNNTERMRIDSSGNVGIGPSGNSVDTNVRMTVQNSGAQNVAWLKNYGGTRASPTENADWPFPVLALSAYGNFYAQTMLSFTLPNDANSQTNGIYHTDNGVWNFRLNGVTGVNSWDNVSGSTTPAISSTADTGLDLLGPGNLRIGTVNAKGIYLRTNGTDQFSVNSSGILNNSSGRPVLKQSGSILQVQSTSYGGTFTSTSTSYVDVGLSVSITPSTTSSKILVMANIMAGSTPFNVLVAWRLVRDSTAIGLGNATGGYTQTTMGNMRDSLDANSAFCVPMQYLDSPGLTSAITYKVQAFCESGTFRLNGSGNDTGSIIWSTRGISTITVMEIAG